MCHTVPKWSESPHKNRACHVWSRYNGLCLVTGPATVYCMYSTYVCMYVCKQKPGMYSCILTSCGWLGFCAEILNFCWDSVRFRIFKLNTYFRRSGFCSVDNGLLCYRCTWLTGSRRYQIRIRQNVRIRTDLYPQLCCDRW